MESFTKVQDDEEKQDNNKCRIVKRWKISKKFSTAAIKLAHELIHELIDFIRLLTAELHFTFLTIYDLFNRYPNLLKYPRTPTPAITAILCKLNSSTAIRSASFINRFPNPLC